MAMWVLCAVGAMVPILSNRWRVFVPLFALAIGLCGLGGYLCIVYGGHEGLAGIICYLIPAMGMLMAVAGLATAICRSVGQARNWRWGKMPLVLVSGGVAYGSAAGALFFLLSI